MPISSALGSSALLPAGLGFRNLLINGGMGINQRNTTITSNGYTLYTVDRWYVDHGTSGGRSIAANSDVPTGSGFTSSLRITATTGATSGGSLPLFGQRIELANCANLAYGSVSAKTVTISFWVKATVVGTYAVKLKANSTYLAPYTILASNVWEKKTLTIAGDTSGAISSYLDVQFCFGGSSGFWGTSNSWVSSTSAYATSGQVDAMETTGNIFAITGVQLEQNYQPTSFEQRPIGVELALCQRYYQLWRGSTPGAGYNHIGFGNGYNTTLIYPVINFETTMRIAPTVIEYSTLTVNDVTTAYAVTALTYESSTINSCRLQATIASGGVQYRGYEIGTGNSASSYLGLGAEL